MKHTSRLLTAAALAVGLLGVTAGPAATAAPLPPKFKNCTELNKKYAHGVGKKGARDKVARGAKPVTTFRVDNALYARNAHLDRDRDGIACEKR